MTSFAKSLLCSALVLQAGVSWADHIVLASGEFAPYSGPGLDKKGIATQIVLQSFAYTGLTGHVEVEFLPWKRAIDFLRTDQASASYPYFKSASRQREFDFSDPLYTSVGLVYGNEKTKGHIEPVAGSLACLPLGFAMGSMAELVDKYKLTLVRPNYLVQCFQLLYKERVEYVFADRDVAEYIVKYKLVPNPGSMYPLPFFQSSSTLHLMVKRTPDSKALLQKFNRGLAEFKQTDEYHVLLKDVHTSLEQ